MRVRVYTYRRQREKAETCEGNARILVEEGETIERFQKDTYSQIRQVQKDITLAPQLRPVAQSHVGPQGKDLASSLNAL